MRTRLCGAIATAVALICAGTMTGAASAQAAGTQLVPGVLPGLSQATLTGPAADSRTLEIGVGIQRPDTAGEDSLLSAIDDPASPEYRHYLTVAQFDDSFGVAPATTQAVRDWLTGGGLSIDTSSAGGDYFTASGTVTQLDALFDVQIGQYTYKGDSFLANDVAPSVPTDLPIDAVAGLETLSHYTPDALHGKQLAHARTAQQAITAGRRIVRKTAHRAHRTHRAHAAAQTAQVGPQAGDEQTYTPQDLWGIYDDPGASALTSADGLSDPATLENASQTLGQGQTVGVFGEGETSSIVKQLRLFENALGLPKVPVRTIETEGTPDDAYGDNSGAVEWYLDSQASTGMAPDAKQLDFYFSKGFQDADITQSFDDWANDPDGPREMNASFGECEQNPTEPITGPLSSLPAGVALGGDAEVLADPALRQAALEGRTLFTSAGDTGSGCPSVVAPVLGGGNGLAIQPVPFQNYPCVSDYVVCVGGTVVSSPGTTYPQSSQRTAETSWTYTGGGTSFFNPAPSYQHGISAIDQPCISDPTGTTVYGAGKPAPLCREVPDVADLSGNSLDDAYFIYTDGQPSEEGGTSLSSPLMMGQWARIQAAAPAATQAGGGLGFANATIYRQAQGADQCTTLDAAPCSDATYDRDFFDVTDSEFGAGNGVYQPHAGWDETSGWGAIDVAHFAQDVDGSTDAADAYTGTEQPAADVCTAQMTSPDANAIDPITDATDNAGIDLTQATLTAASAQTITATLTVPDLRAGPPAESTAGASYYVAWEYNGVVDYAVAHESEAGATWTYSSGTTGPAFTDGTPNLGAYTDTSPTQATGTADTSSGLITITIPSSEVGSPPAGAVLSDAQAFVQIDVGVPDVATALALTDDSADTLGSYSADGGATDSAGADVVVAGVAGSTCNNLPTPPGFTSPSGAPAGGTGTAGGGAGTAAGSPAKGTPRPRSSTVCTGAGPASTHVRQRRLTGRRLKLTGIAKAHCPDHITRVSVSIARVTGHRCRFLLARGRFGRPRACAPRDYRRAKGTRHWSLKVTARLPRGRYFIWERAVDNRHRVIRNQARKHITLRVR